MVLGEIADSVEKRRHELVDMLENNSSLNLEKQHQIYGAINEIDMFLQTLSYYEKNPTEAKRIDLFKPPEEEPGIFARLFSNVKKKVLKNK